MKYLLLSICLLLPAVSQAAIFKCVQNGKTTYQSVPCPAAAEEEDVSQFEHSQRMYSPGNRYEQNIEDVYRERRERQSLREMRHDNIQTKEANERKRQRAVQEARRQSAEAKREKAERDRLYREEKIRRKARNSGNYEYWDINVR